MHGLLQDLRAALRFLARTPGVSLAALLCLALGIGGNTAIFSAVRSVLLKPLPYEQAHRLVWVWGTWNGDGREPLSDPDFLDLRADDHSFAELGAYGGDEGAVLGTEGSPETVRVRSVSSGYLRALAGAPARGRFFTAEEERPGGEPVAVVSDALRRRRFAAADLVGSTLRLGGVAYRVVGILPPSFRDLSDRPDRLPDVWVPVQLDPAAPRGMHRLLVVGRLAAGSGAAAAQQELSAIAARLERLHPDTNQGKGWRTEDLQEGVVRGARRGLLILLAAVGLVLVIACANVASLLLARSSGRARETAVRTTLGAGRLRLLRQHLMESALLGVLGGVVGLLLAGLGVQALVRLGSGLLPLSDRIAIDGGVLVFALAVSVFATVLCGFFPWVSSLRSDLVQALRGGAAAGPRSGRLSRSLVAAEVALAVLVTLAAGMLAQSLHRLRSVDVGFRSRGVAVARLTLPEAEYPAPAQVADLFDRLLARHRAQSEVVAAALAASPPFSPYLSCFGFEIVGREQPPSEQAPCADLRAVGDGYFATLDIPLLAGRAPRAAEPNGEAEAVVNRRFEKEMFPDGDALGQRVRFGDAAYTVVGVVGDSRTASLSYGPILQVYRGLRPGEARSLYLVARAGNRAEGQFPLLRSELAALDAGLAFDSLDSLERVLDGTVGSHRARSVLMGLFAVIGLTLAAIGVFGVLSQAVARRTREIGIRVAVGAGPRAVLKMVMRQGMVPVAMGLAAGLLAALVLGRFLSSVLFEAAAYQGRTYLVVPLVVLVLGAAACWLPARRALRIDPARALRVE